MKVLNLRCNHDHPFEGWFSSEDEFQTQLAGGLLVCPLCGDVGIVKMPSAPRLNFGAAPHESLSSLRPSATGDVVGPNASTGALSVPSDVSQSVDGQAHPAEISRFRAALLEMAALVVANTEDVGDGFASEARKIHYGESEERGIRGKATPRQARELLDEGIGVLPLPTPEHLKGPLQ